MSQEHIQTHVINVINVLLVLKECLLKFGHVHVVHQEHIVQKVQQNVCVALKILKQINYHVQQNV